MRGEGGGYLAFERAGERTVLRAALAASPLRLLTPQNHGSAAWVYTSTLGGGLVGGDRIRLRVDVAAGARALLTTQGATRVYRSAQGAGSELDAAVGDGALLAVVPDPTVCFAGAALTQRVAVALAPGASLVLADWLAAGRLAAGERWAFRRYAASLTITAPPRTLLAEAWLLDPAHGPLAERFGRFDAVATVVLAGPLLAPARVALLAALATAPLVPRAGVVESVSPLGDDALVLRLAATSIARASAALRARLAFLPGLLGDDPWARRAG